MSGSYKMHGVNRNAYKIVIGKHQMKVKFWRRAHRWGNNIKMMLDK